MKPQVLTQGNLMKLFYKTNRYGNYSITVSAIESWNKIQKQLKNMLLKNLSPYKVSLIFVLNYINNSFYHVKIYLRRMISIINYTVRFLFTALFVIINNFLKRCHHLILHFFKKNFQ